MKRLVLLGFVMIGCVSLGLTFDGTKQLARKGDVTAQNDLGRRYYEGDQVQKDTALAMKWTRRAALQGNPQALLRVAKMYEYREEILPSVAEDFERYSRLAAEQGDDDAQASLANLLDTGLPATPDLREPAMAPDPVSAYFWMALSGTAGDLYRKDHLARDLAVLAAKMTPEQIAEARIRLQSWKPKTWDELKNLVTQ